MGSARLSPEAQHYFDMYMLLGEIGGITLSDLTGGEVFKEDFAYLLACERFKVEAQSKWNSDNSRPVTGRR